MSEDKQIIRQQAAAELRCMINGYQVSQAIHVAAVLGVADYMATGPRSSDEIAAKVAAHPEVLYRLLRALSAVGVFQEHENRHFSLTAIGMCLRSDVEPSERSWATLIGQAYRWQSWGHLLHSVKTGENAFRALYGMDIWAYRKQHPGQSTIFNAAMTGTSRCTDQAIVSAFDFSHIKRIVDIGGGQGSLLAAVLVANKAVRGVLFDLPHVAETAMPVLEASGVSNRCEVVGGSMFESLPKGCDAYMMKFILHDWNDADSIRILRTCRNAMYSEAGLLVIERLVGPPNEDPAVKLSDLGMLVVLGGQERTLEEFEALFQAGGFYLVDALPVNTHLTLMLGKPA